jgi:hypothetical protein
VATLLNLCSVGLFLAAPVKGALKRANATETVDECTVQFAHRRLRSVGSI